MRLLPRLEGTKVPPCADTTSAEHGREKRVHGTNPNATLCYTVSKSPQRTPKRGHYISIGENADNGSDM